jgi:ABC-type transporter Mla subunit MlaD
MTEHYHEYNQSNDKDDNNSDGEELVIDDRIGEQRRAEEEQQRLLTQIAQSTQDASDELRLMNDNIENLTREVHGTKEAIKSLTDVLRKYLDNKNQDKDHNKKA